MAGWKIGLDFGTHYTKICVEDSTDKRNKRYRYLKYKDQKGEPQYVFPSVVQINKDNTLSYGFVDTQKALLVEGLPEKNPPQKPQEPKYHSYTQFPELIEPKREDFFSGIERKNENKVDSSNATRETDRRLNDIKTKCLRHFNLLNRCHTWEDVDSNRVIAIIKNFTTEDIQNNINDEGLADYDGLVNLAVERSKTQTFSPEKQESKKDGASEASRKKQKPKKYPKEIYRQKMLEAHYRYEEARGEYIKKSIRRESEIVQDKVEVDAYNKGLREEYERRLALWEEYENSKNKPIPAVFRSFKQMVFSEGYDWRFEMDPMLVSIWYLTYIFFDLDEDYKTQYLTVCMGTSSGQDNWEANKKKATQIILTVYDLIENVYNHDKRRFLKATLDELIRVTTIKPFSQEAKELNQIYVFPEAFANLNPLAKRSRFETGVNAVVDIGGGTTDISFFTAARGDDVHIFDYISIPYGVNAIEKNGREVHYKEVEKRMKVFSKEIIQHAYQVGVKQGEAAEIVYKRPIVFIGGGSMRPELRRPYQGFTDVIHIGSALINHYAIEDADVIAQSMPLLTTALGLALCKEKDEAIQLIITYEILFETVEEKNKGISKDDSFDYEHGLSQWW